MTAFRRRLVTVVLLAVVVVSLARAHDMFLKPAAFFVAEHAPVPTILLNGTFGKSENSITRERIADLSLVSPAGRARLDTTRWDATGDTSRVTLETGAAGTYLFGVSTRPSEIELDPKDFNDYLRLDGIPDELARRRRAGELARPATERYSKHVKTLIQVGEARSDGYATVLGYPAEIVPLENPYAVRLGGSLRVRVLIDGLPLPNAYLLYGGTTAGGSRIAELATRSDSAGVARIRLTARGVWYLKVIAMKRLDGDPGGITHESKWATLTFGVR